MLVVLTLQTQLQRAFMNAFNSINTSNENVKVTKEQVSLSLAREIAQAIDSFVKSGTVRTTVTVAGYGGVYTGTGIGSVM